MPSQIYTTTFAVDQTPEEAFAAIIDVRLRNLITTGHGASNPNEDRVGR